MAKRNNEVKYVESMVLFIYDNTKGLEAELNALTQAIRIKKVHWTGKPIGVKAPAKAPVKAKK